MLAVGPLREQFARLREQAPASGDLLRSAFCKLPFSVARELLAAGLHPRSVPRHWVPELLRALPEKLYLVRPRHMQLQDLLVVLERHSNLELYAAHLEYFKHELLRAADAFLLARCVPTSRSSTTTCATWWMFSVLRRAASWRAPTRAACTE